MRIRFMALLVTASLGAAALLTGPALADSRPAATQKQAKPRPAPPVRTHRVPAAEVAPARPAWMGADPTRGAGIEQLRREQAQGHCVIDEGYGRWSACNAE